MECAREQAELAGELAASTCATSALRGLTWQNFAYPLSNAHPWQVECAREQADLAGELAEREAELAAVSAQAAEREAAAGAAAQQVSDAERRLQVPHLDGLGFLGLQP